jgi:hypothetical protein
MPDLKCRDCGKIEPRGVGKTCCEVDKHVINDFDAECTFFVEFEKTVEIAESSEF